MWAVVYLGYTLWEVVSCCTKSYYYWLATIPVYGLPLLSVLAFADSGCGYYYRLGGLGLVVRFYPYFRGGCILNLSYTGWMAGISGLLV